MITPTEEKIAAAVQDYMDELITEIGARDKIIIALVHASENDMANILKLLNEVYNKEE